MSRGWLSLAMLACGGAMLATTALAGPPMRQGGIFTVGNEGASVQIDPQVAYVSTAWWLEYATAAKLFNWPDRPGPLGNRLVPEAAASYAVSNRGRTYTFFIRPGFRFSDGTPVTAKSFAYAFDRVANHTLESPGAQFITDSNGTNIVGAKAVNDGYSKHVSGVTAKGNRLNIRLTKPDGSFLTKLTMPFFQATSTTLPLTHAVTGAYPSAGPYRFTRNDPNVTSIRRNPYWKRGAGRMRPRHLAGLDVNWNQNEPRRDQFDEVSPPPAEVQGLAHKYGVNKTRFWVEPVNCVGWLLFNNREGLFRNNIPMRKAVNWAVDRRAYLSVAAPFTGSPWTNLLPPGIPGASRAQPFAGAPKMPRARRLARGHFRSGKVSIVYLSSGTVNPNQANSIRRDLIKLGFKPENVTLKGLSGSVIVFPPDRGWDIASSTGWCADYPDPYAFFLPLLSARYYEPWAPAIAEPRYRREIARAAQLIGNARLRAFARVETELMRNLAPVAPMRTYNNRYFFSNRVDPRSLSYQPVYSDWSIPELALK